MLEIITLGWNVIGIVVLAIAAIAAHSIALGGFGLDSLIEIGASAVVVWELKGIKQLKQRQALTLIGGSFIALALYLSIQSFIIILIQYHPSPSPLGIVWTATTALIMLSLAVGKNRIGKKLNNPVLLTEGKVTAIDALLALAVLAGLVLNSLFSWWWADPISSFVLVYYAAKEAAAILRN